WAEGQAQPALSAAVRRVEDGLPAPLPDGYRSEIALALPAWIEALGDCIDRGALMLVDYGYVRRDYYHPQRDGGTLICHYRHRAPAPARGSRSRGPRGARPSGTAATGARGCSSTTATCAATMATRSATAAR